MRSNGATSGTFLVDGVWQGIWQIRDQTMLIQPFTKLRRTERDALLTASRQMTPTERLEAQLRHSELLFELQRAGQGARRKPRFVSFRQRT